MLSKMKLGHSLLALLPIVFGAPTSGELSNSTASIDWTPVDFNGKTLYINTAALVDPSTITARSILYQRDVPTNNCCGDSTINGHPSPYPTVGDCAVIRDWAYSQNFYMGVWDNTPDTHGLLYYGSCVFEAGTRTYTETTYIGSTDIGDLTRDTINILQANGVVAGLGGMFCDQITNNNDLRHQSSYTTWKIKHS